VIAEGPALSTKRHIFVKCAFFLFKYMMHNYFHHLPNLPVLPRMYVKLAERATYQWPEEHKLPSLITLSNAPEFARSKFVLRLERDFPKITVAYFRNEPTSFYDWHCDKGTEKFGPRSCCINYPVSENAGAVTMFRDHSYNKMNHGVEICDYTLFRGTLFNTQHPHAVLNPSDRPRYILSVSFYNVKFEDARDYLSAVKIDKYE